MGAVKINNRPSPCELPTKPVSKIVQPASAIRVFFRRGIDCHLRNFDSTVEIVHRFGPLESPGLGAVSSCVCDSVNKLLNNLERFEFYCMDSHHRLSDLSSIGIVNR